MTRQMKTLMATVVSMLVVLPALAQDDGYMRDIHWTTAQQTEGTALWLFRAGDERHEVIMLAAAPSGARYVFRRTLDAAGVMRVRMTHDASGWWMELTKDFQVHGPTFSAFAKALDPDNLPKDHAVTMSLKTSAKTAAGPIVVPYSFMGDEYQPFATALASSDIAASLRQQLPADVAGSLAFFEAAFQDGQPGFEFRSAIGFLREVLGAVETPARVVVEKGKAVRGTAVSDRQRYEFASGFRSLDDPRNPMPAVR